MRGINFGNLINYHIEVSNLLRLRNNHDVRELLLSLYGLILEYLMHICSQNTQIIVIVDSSAINSIFKDTIDFLPLNARVISFVLQIQDNSLSSLQVTIRELVIFGPTLWNIGSSLLDKSVVPRENEKKLSLGQFQLLTLSWSNILEGPHQVVSDTWRSLVGNLQA